jgi:ABC-type spermidine/putrescine transport system permease subunit II
MDDLMQAALYTLIVVTSVSALAVVLFGVAGALERWLDDSRGSATVSDAVDVAGDQRARY